MKLIRSYEASTFSGITKFATCLWKSSGGKPVPSSGTHLQENWSCLLNLIFLCEARSPWKPISFYGTSECFGLSPGTSAQPQGNYSSFPEFFWLPNVALYADVSRRLELFWILIRNSPLTLISNYLCQIKLIIIRILNVCLPFRTMVFILGCGWYFLIN